MSNFVVSARKYRPDHFNTVVGQSHITKTLKTAIKNNQLAQAFLFCGPRGVGKTSCARILAKTINCTNLTEDFEACGVCNSCISFKNGNSFNIHELDAASNNSVEDIRGLVEQVRYAPQAGKYKIYIIDEVHMLSSSAFNAFLKTLEEPPPYAIFILATTEKHKIIPTILSRCQIFDFHRIQVKDIASHLEHIAREEAIRFEPEALHIIAQKADGALRDALSAFDQLAIFTDGSISYKAVIENLNILDYDYYFKVTDALLAENVPTALLIFDEILRNGFNGNDFINGLCSHFRDLLVSRDESTVGLLELSEQTRKLYLEQTRKTSTSFLLSALTIGNQCEINYRSSKNPRLQVELALIKMCHIQAAFKLKSDPQVAEKKNSKPDAGTVAELNIPKTSKDDPVPPALTDQAESNTGKTEAGAGVVEIDLRKLSSEAGLKQELAQEILPASEQKESEQQPLEQVVDGKSLPSDLKEALDTTASTGIRTEARKTASSGVKFRIPSAEDLTKKEEKKEDAKEESPVEEEEDTRIILKSDLMRHWKIYAELMLSQLKKNVHTILTAYEPELEGNVIHIKVENSLQKEMISSEVPDLQLYVREKLEHRSLRILSRLMESTEEKKKILISSQDKFKYMAEKNPYLSDFKQKLDLDLDR